MDTLRRNDVSRAHDTIAAARRSRPRTLDLSSRPPAEVR